MLCIAIGRSGPIVWNPCTGKLKILPTLENHWLESGSVIYGFGYDRFSDSYKVVAVCMRPWDVDVKVHTLGIDSWRGIRKFPPCLPSYAPGRFVSGTLNWVARDMTGLLWVIVSLDLGSETYRQLLPPVGGVDGDNVALSLAVLKDCLCILAHCRMVSDVWIMKDYGNKESWTKLFGVPYYFGECPRLRTHYYKRALCISDEDDEILLEYEINLVVYNSKSGTFKTPEVQWFRSVDVYAESLISPC